MKGEFFVACTSPKICFLERMPDGKKKLCFVSDSSKYETDEIKGVYDLNNTLECFDRGMFVKIPCGQCINCRLKYASEWATRIMLEASQYSEDRLCVLTLTYSDDKLPTRHCKLYVKGVGDLEYDSHPLIKEHLSGFMKRLRKGVKDRFDLDGVRFFACGEYGENPRKSNSFPFRPHFHVILFGCPVFDLVYHSKSKSNYNNYTSQFFQQFWPYGFVTVNHLEYDMASYVARYTLKKTNGKDKTYWYDQGLTPEFVNMSRRPGIGYGYYDLHRDSLAETFNVSLLKNDRPVTLPLPRYFVKKFEDDNVFVDKLGMYQDGLKADLDLSDEITMSLQQYLSQMDEKSREVDSRLLREVF